ncbi:MAG: type II toxin-antitoxin system MqsA family antitoxin [Planctomycetes bacterium]|nr:type II toxin-antitoxin system MqsA family antitoxin [Planctomycetota bacterium]
MNCSLCKKGAIAPGHTTVTLERGETTVVIRNVPADVCANCGEYYLSQQVTQEVLEMAEDAVRKGVDVQILRYAA